MAGEINVPIVIDLRGIPALLKQYQQLFRNLEALAKRPIPVNLDMFSPGDRKNAEILFNSIGQIQKEMEGAVSEGRRLGIVLSDIVPVSSAVKGSILEEAAARKLAAEQALKQLQIERQRVNIPRQEALSREISTGRSFGPQLAEELKKAGQEAVRFGQAQALSSRSVEVQNRVIQNQLAVLADASQAFDDYAHSVANLPIEEQIPALRGLQSSLRAAASEIEKLRQLEKGKEKEDRTFTENLRLQREAYLKAAQGTEVYISKVREQISEQKKAAKGTRELVETHDLLNDRIAVAIGKLLRYRIAFFVLRGAMDAVRDSFNAFVDTQKNLAQLEKVIDPLSTSMENLRDIGFDFAKAYAVSIDEVTKVMTLWAQTGLDTNDTIHATRAALKATNATNVEATAIVEALTSAIFAYGIQAEETTRVVDKWIAVQAKFPANAEDLLKALQGIGVVAKDFGVTIDDLNGLVAGIGAITRKSGGQVADALKTILARLPRAETIKAFQDIGVAVVRSDGSFRDFVDILRDTSKATKNLSQIQIDNLALTASGIRRYVEFTAALKNFNVIEEAIAVSIQSAGASTRAANIEISTFAASIRQTQANLKEAGFIIGEELSKPLTLLLNILNNVVDSFKNNGKTVVQVTAGFLAFSAIFVALAVTMKGFSFILSVVNKKLGEYSKGLTVATALTKGLSGAVVTATGAQATWAGTIGATIGKISPYLIALSSLITIFSLLKIKTEEYKVITEETGDSVGNQVKAIVEAGKSLRDHNNLLQDIIDQRKSLVQQFELAEDEDERKKALEAILELDKTIGINKGKIADISRRETQDNKLAIGLQGEFEEALRREMTLNDQNFEILEKQFQLQKKRLGQLQAERDNLDKTRQAFLDFEKIDLFGNLSSTLSSLSNIEPIRNTEDALLFLDLASKKAARAIDAVNTKIQEVKDRLRSDPNADQDQITLAITELDKKIAPTIQGIQALKTKIDSFRSLGKQKLIDLDQKSLNEANTALIALGNQGISLEGIFSGLVSDEVKNLSVELQKTDESLAAIDPSNLQEAIAKLKEDGKDLKDIFLNFIKSDVSLQFIRQFNKIKEEIDNLEEKVGRDFLAAGIEKDAKRRADSVASFISSNINDLNSLVDSLQSSLDAAIERRDFLQEQFDKDPVFAKTLELDKPLDQAKEMVEALKETRDKLLPGIIDKIKTETERLKEANIERAKQNLLEARRSAALDKIDRRFQDEIEILQAMSFNEGEILEVERQRLIALSKEKQAQLLVSDSIESQAKLLAELNDLTGALVKNARDINLFKLKKDMEDAVKLAQSLQSVLSSAFGNIPTSLVEGIEKRRELTLDMKEAELELQKAIAEGDQEAIASAKFRIKELKSELDEFKSVIFELRTLGKNLFVGIGAALNQAISEKFAKDIIELDFGGQQLGNVIANAILNVNNNFIRQQQVLNNDYLAKQQLIFDFAADQMAAAVSGATIGTDLSTLNKSTQQVGQETIRSLDALQGELFTTKTTLKDVLQSGFLQLTSVLSAAIGAAAGGGGPSAAAGGQIGGLAGNTIGSRIGALGGPIGALIGSAIGGAIGGLFDDRVADRFIGAFESNTEALRDNTLTLKQLDRNIINAPSNFVFPQVFGGGQSPNIQINVNGSGSPEAVANRVAETLSRELSLGNRIGTTRRAAF